ncbi:hypothetical protein Celaphus_00016999, partial [Cervus elaphus hippelaphus]
MGLDECSHSSREQDIVEGDRAWKGTLGPRKTYALRQCCKPEFQGFTDQQKEAQGCAAAALLQEYATDTFLKDCHWNMFLAANIIPLSCSQTLS